MRIKQSRLPTKPDKYYIRFVNGIYAIIYVYHKPCYCVNVITHNGKNKHCYPLTKEQYNVYMTGSIKEQKKLIAKGGKIYERSR